MKLTRTRYGVKTLLVLLCCAIQYGLLEAKAIRKPKHAVHKSGSKKHNAPKGNFCVNHSYCSKYSDLDCASEWVQLNCPRMCRLCEYEGPELMNLPAVLYYKKGDKKHGITGSKHKSKHAAKHMEKRDDGDRRDVVFLSRPQDYSPTKPQGATPTTSYKLFDYQSNYRNWLFLYPDQHPVHMQYVDQGKAADPNQQNAAQQTAAGTQDAATAGAAPASPAGAAAPAVAPAAAAGAAPAAAPATGAVPAIASTTADAAAPSVAPAAATPAVAPAAPAAAPTAAQAAAAPATPAAGAAAGLAPAAAQAAAPAVAAPAVAAAANPAVPQVGQAAAGVQQPAAPVTAQQPIAAQQPAANETIQVLNQTVSLASNTTGFQPSVANASQTNQTIMAGAFIAGNNTANQTAASGNITSQNQSQPWVEPLSQNSTLSQNASLSENSSLSQNFSLTQTPALAQNQTNPQNASSANATGTSALLEDQSSTEESLESPSTSSMPPFHLSEEEVTSEHKLHLVNSDESSKMQGNFNPNGASVTLSGPGTLDLTSTGQSFTQDVNVDPQAADSEYAPDYSWTCCKKQPRPEGCKKCPDLPKAPPVPNVFSIYCNDLYKDCAYGYSNCNDTWWQINCPKRCNLCRNKDAQNTEATETKEIYPTEVKDLKDNAALESDLVAPAPGRKPLVAKYTLRVKPKLLNGVAQTQEIRIMPPNKAGVKGYIKPLMVLKQNITKPMIENIEIDIPPKGAKFSSKPSVEVIEGDHTEMLKVSKGEAIVEDPVQKSKTEPEETKPEKEETPETTTDTTAKTTTDTTTDTTTETASDQTQSSSATPQEAAQSTASDQPDAQTQSPWDSQAAPTADQTTQADATTAQAAAPATEAATATTTQTYAAQAATTQPDASAAQTAAYTSTQTCSDDTRCGPYTPDRCADPWLRENCKSMCKLC